MLYVLQVGVHVQHMAVSLQDHSHLQPPEGGSQQPARQLFRRLMQNRELQHISAQQEQQLQALQQELARLRARNFPSFEGVEPGGSQQRAPPADLDPRLIAAYKGPSHSRTTAR